MGAGVQHGGGGGRRYGRQRHRAMSEINVTPMVDVMLVLLVIFMVTAPLLTVGVQVDLPKTHSGPITGDDEPLTVSIRANDDLYLQETKIELDALVPRLEAITKAKKDQRIFVRGDKTIPYGRVMEVMGVINQAGFNKVALLTEQPKDQGKTKGKK
ncbi:TolR protein [Rhodospirillaceae bacterium LM-1]|nr:TolR protein [Rhodospirillaceae bacterium LM-1]